MRNRSIRRKKNTRSRSCKSITKRHHRGGEVQELRTDVVPANTNDMVPANTNVVAPTDPNCSWWKRTFYGCPPVVGGRKKRNVSAKKRNVSFK